MLIGVVFLCINRTERYFLFLFSFGRQLIKLEIDVRLMKKERENDIKRMNYILP